MDDLQPDQKTDDGAEGTEGGLTKLYAAVQRTLSVLLVVAVLLFVLSWWRRGSFPDASEIRPILLEEAAQEPTDRQPFSFVHYGTTYEVTPRADYEMWGLVVSHNNIGSFADIYHDENSVDVKDLCTIWGGNLKTNDFHKVEFKSDCYVCRFRYYRGTKFNHHELANTHVISSDPLVLRGIGDVRIGDQVRLKGLLVNYNVLGTDWERKSSMTRKDEGMGACEVMFVEEVEILEPGTPAWYLIYALGKHLIWTLLLVKIGLLIAKAIRDQKDYQRRIAESGS